MAENRELDSDGADALVRHLQATSDAAGGTARLPSADHVRARGDRRRHRRNASLALSALILAAGVGAGAFGLGTDQRAPVAPAVSTTTPPPTTPAPTPTAVTAEDLLDGSREVELLAPDGLQLTATVEGGLIVSADAATDSGGVPTTWVVRPSTGAAVQLLSVGAEVDGRDMCANVVDAETVGFADCDPSDPAQNFAPGADADTVPVDGSVATSATFRSGLGYLVVSDGRLGTDPDASASTSFTLQDAGPARGTP